MDPITKKSRLDDERLKYLYVAAAGLIFASNDEHLVERVRDRIRTLAAEAVSLIDEAAKDLALYDAAHRFSISPELTTRGLK